MILFEPFDGVDYEKESFDDFVSNQLPVEGWEEEELGIDDWDNMIYGYKLGDFSKPCIFIRGSVHGDEWESSYWQLEFMKELVNPSVPYKKIVRKLLNYFCFYSIPCANPSGFEAETRENGNDVDLNRDNVNVEETETQIFHSKFSEIKPVTFIDNHTVDTSTEYLGTGDIVTEGQIDISVVVDKMLQSMSFMRPKKVELYPWGELTDERRARVWASRQETIRGSNCFSILVEGARQDFLGTKEANMKFGVISNMLISIQSLYFFKESIYNPVNQ